MQIFWVKEYVCPKSIHPKKLWIKEFWVHILRPTNFVSKTIFGPKMWVEENFEVKDILGSKKLSPYKFWI